MVSALGKNGQILNVVPSENLVMVRMGNAPPDFAGAVSVELNRQIWERFNRVKCTTRISEAENALKFSIHPNPATDYFTAWLPGNERYRLQLFSLEGKLVFTEENCSGKTKFRIEELDPGWYLIRILTADRKVIFKPLVIR
jgi:hypothetical protein